MSLRGLDFRVSIGLLAFLCLALGVLGQPRPGWGRNSTLEVRRVGLSRVGENTLLTVVLNRPADPLVSQRISSAKPQLTVDFAQAQAGHLPSRLNGDELLVEQVRTEVTPGRAGVRIILDLYPERPFTFWRLSRYMGKDQAVFIVGLKAEGSSPQTAGMLPPGSAEPPGTVTGEEPEPGPAERSPQDYRYQEERETVASGSFAEIRRLIPKAAPLLQGLESEGWVIDDSHNYDRPGQRFSRDFILTNRQYPELVVKIANLPANTPGEPAINLITLAMDNLAGEDANEYRQLRHWNFARIKEHYEDIGDFFDDALKPLRVKIRQQCQTLALRQASLWQNFLKRACPANPRVAEEVMGHVREKVNPRFEGVQFTVSENPLIILNMVDFLYVRVYFLEAS
jgi:hypothetical protein